MTIGKERVMKHTPSRLVVTSAIAVACLIGGAVAANAATSGSPSVRAVRWA
jgi:hypothetical protein